MNPSVKAWEPNRIMASVQASVWKPAGQECCVLSWIEKLNLPCSLLLYWDPPSTDRMPLPRHWGGSSLFRLPTQGIVLEQRAKIRTKYTGIYGWKHHSETHYFIDNLLLKTQHSTSINVPKTPSVPPKNNVLQAIWAPWALWSWCMILTIASMYTHMNTWRQQNLSVSIHFYC